MSPLSTFHEFVLATYCKSSPIKRNECLLMYIIMTGAGCLSNYHNSIILQSHEDKCGVSIGKGHAPSVSYGEPKTSGFSFALNKTANISIC